MKIGAQCLHQLLIRSLLNRSSQEKCLNNIIVTLVVTLVHVESTVTGDSDTEPAKQRPGRPKSKCLNNIIVTLVTGDSDTEPAKQIPGRPKSKCLNLTKESTVTGDSDTGDSDTEPAKQS